MDRQTWHLRYSSLITVASRPCSTTSARWRSRGERVKVQEAKGKALAEGRAAKAAAAAKKAEERESSVAASVLHKAVSCFPVAGGLGRCH